MTDISKWNFYYNEEPGDKFRANLVYTPYISPDKKTLCMRFFRDTAYHTDIEENKLWTEELLNERFQRELKFYNLAKQKMPVADILEIEEKTRSIYIRWPKDDFYMMGYQSSYNTVLPNWKEQIKQRFREMWSMNILKFSIHPNSWIIYQDGILRPFNWFFTFLDNEHDRPITDFLIQISSTRIEILNPILNKYGYDIDSIYTLKELQNLALETFKKNYPCDLIEDLKIIKKEFYQ